MARHLGPWRRPPAQVESGNSSGRRRTEMREAAARLRDLQLDIPEPFELGAFTDSLADRRGRDIWLIPVSFWEPASAGMICGVCVAEEHCDCVFYNDKTSPFHKAFIAVHELSHLIWGHQPQKLLRRVVATPSTATAIEPGAPPQEPARPSPLGIVLSGYSLDDEKQADAMAAVILATAESSTRSWRAPSTVRAGAGRLAAVFW